MHGKQVSARHVIIIDELSPGVFDVDNQGDLHAAKVCMAALCTFKHYIQHVDDELMYRELHDKFNAIMGIVKDPKAKPFVPPTPGNLDVDLKDNLGDPPGGF